MIDPIMRVLNEEGGFVIDPNDHGGATNYGITISTLSEWLQRPATVDDVRNLTLEEAHEIYTIKYLSGPRIDTLPEPPRNQVLDIRVMRGPKIGIKMLQRVLNSAGFGPVEVDGVIGPGTRSACVSAQSQMGTLLNNAVVDERINYYKAIVDRDSTQARFIKGWTNRANSWRI